jgi:hypothetical protein
MRRPFSFGVKTMTHTIELSTEERYVLDIELETRLYKYRNDLRAPVDAAHEEILNQFIAAILSVRAKLYSNHAAA